jgi:CheY-like chemotaxis protein
MIKVLIVDDEVSLVKALRLHLDKEGYETEVAYDGLEALQKVGLWQPDIVLLDIYMPKLNGIDTLKILKKKPETKNIPVIMLTNYDDRDKIVETSETGSLLYFVKANTKLSLLSTYIHQLLDQ